MFSGKRNIIFPNYARKIIIFQPDSFKKTIFSADLEKKIMFLRTVLALIGPLPVKRFPNKLAPKVSNNIPRNYSFCSFASFLIVSLMSFINHPDSSRDLTIFIISFISLLEIISVVKPDLEIFL